MIGLKLMYFRKSSSSLENKEFALVEILVHVESNKLMVVIFHS